MDAVTSLIAKGKNHGSVSQNSFGQCHGLKGKKQKWASDATCGTCSGLMWWGLFIFSRTICLYFRLCGTVPSHF